MPLGPIPPVEPTGTFHFNLSHTTGLLLHGTLSRADGFTPEQTEAIAQEMVDSFQALVPDGWTVTVAEELGIAGRVMEPSP